MDPFGNDPFQHMERQMRNMQRMMDQAFGNNMGMNMGGEGMGMNMGEMGMNMGGMGMDMGGFFNDPFFQGGGRQQPPQQAPRQRQIQPPQLVEIQDEEEENEFGRAGGQQPIVEEPDEDYNQNQQQQFNGNYMNNNKAVGQYDPNPNRGNNRFNRMFMNPGMGQSGNFQSSYSYSSYSSSGPGGVSYQETSQTNMGPGGVMESRRSVRDSRSGKEQVEVTRGLQDRGRTVQRTRFRDGREEAVDTLHNMTPEQANQFDGDWQQAANRHLGGNRLGSSRGSWRQQQFRQIGDGYNDQLRRY